MTQDEIIRAVDALNRTYCSYKNNKEEVSAKEVSKKILELIKKIE